MKIRLNGKVVETAETTVAALLAAEGFAADAVATAVNGEFVPRSERPGAVLADGDTVEVVSPRQGG